MMIIFALSNGLFIAGNLAAGNAAVPLLNLGKKKQLNSRNSLQENALDAAQQSVTENTTRRLR